MSPSHERKFYVPVLTAEEKRLCCRRQIRRRPAFRQKKAVMRQLIINADDFGFCRSVNAGIILAHQAGALTSASLLAAGESFEEALVLARQNPRLGIGVHVALVDARPVSAPAAVTTLLGPDGRLRNSFASFAAGWLTGKIKPSEVRTEIQSQVHQVLATGLHPAHLDTHKHTGVLPGILSIMAEVAGQHGIAAVRMPFDSDPWRGGLANPSGRRLMRQQWSQARLAGLFRPAWHCRARRAGLRHPSRFFGVAFTGFWTRAYLQHVLSRLPDGISELMCHPGLPDPELAGRRTRLRESRASELELLQTVLPPLIERYGIRLVNFSTFQTP